MTKPELHVVMGHDDEGPCAVYCKGHVGAEEFYPLALEWLDNESPGFVDQEAFPLSGMYIKNEYWRTVRMRDDYAASNRFIRSVKGRGAYAVTVLDLRDWER